MPSENAIKVFISYSHDSPEHKERVLALANKLRERGVDARIDRYEQFPSIGWPRWMERQIAEANFVLVVCTEPYCKKANGELKIGKGVAWESCLTYQELYDNVTENTKFIPIVLSDADVDHIPKPLRPYTHYCVDTDDGFESLYRYISNQPETPPPDLGSPVILPPAASPSPSAVHQLPPPPRDFTGREDELAELRAAIKEGHVAISGLRGMGGIGKTALALKLAEELAQDYPDAQICLDLRGTSQPLPPAKAMEHVIRAFHPDAKLPEEESQIAALYQSVLSGKRVLLLMDNARDSKQLENLVPPAGNFLLVTSREHVTLPGLKSAAIRTLPLADANELLLKISPRIGAKATALAKACGCLPLALRLAATALEKHRTVSVDSYLKRLADAATRTKELAEPALVASYDLLSEELKVIWRRLAVFPSTFDAAAVASVCELKEDAAAGRLGDLVASSLVECDDATGRCRLHDLARDFAAAKLGGSETVESPVGAHGVRPIDSFRNGAPQGLYPASPEHAVPESLCGTAGLGLRSSSEVALPSSDSAEVNLESARPGSPPVSQEAYVARKRHAAYYLEVLRTADALYLEGGENVVKGLALFDLERANIEAGFSWSAANLHSDTDAARMTNSYPGAGHYCLDLRQHPRTERIPWLDKALEAARTLKDRGAEARHLCRFGSAYYALGNARKAIEYYEKALLIHQEIGDRRGEGQDLGNLGNACAALGDARKAIEYHEKALAIDQEIGDRRGEGQDLGNLGLAYADLGDARKAIEYYEKALLIHQEIGDHRGEGTALGNLGNAYYALGNARKAIQYHEKALVIDREIGDRRGEGADLGNLGLAYAALGDARKAIEYYEKRIAIAVEIGDRRGEGNALWNKALALDSLGKRPEAIPSAEAALKIYEAIEDPAAAKVRARLADWKSGK